MTDPKDLIAQADAALLEDELFFPDPLARELRDALAAALARAEALEAERDRLREAVNWYEVQAAGARLIHSGGDVARANLAADGGARARAALSVEPHP